MRAKRSARLGRAAGTTAVLLVVSATVALSLVYPKYFDLDPNALADPDALAENFERVVSIADHAPYDKQLIRWQVPIRYTVWGTRDERHLERLHLYVTELRSLTGLGISKASSRETANVLIFFTPRQEFHTAMRHATRLSGTEIRELIRFAECLVGNPGKSGDQILVAIRTDWERRMVNSCLLEELAHLVGMSNHSSRLRPSIISQWDDLTQLSLHDKILIRTLYDDRLASGMEREDAMRVAREVIVELVDRVKAEGDGALIHPRYRGAGL